MRENTIILLVRLEKKYSKIKNQNIFLKRKIFKKIKKKKIKTRRKEIEIDRNDNKRFNRDTVKVKIEEIKITTDFKYLKKKFDPCKNYSIFFT